MIWIAMTEKMLWSMMLWVVIAAVNLTIATSQALIGQWAWASASLVPVVISVSFVLAARKSIVQLPRT